MFRKYIRFTRGVAVNRVGMVGVVLTTSSFIIFIILEIARLVGILTNARVGLITYLLFPALFVVGLVLISVGWHLYRKKTGKNTKELLKERFDAEQLKGGFFGSKLALTVGFFTLVNILFLSAASSRMLNFMDEPRFCGTACHSVMNPEWVTYQQSSHARVKCIDCHVGEGIGALIDSKLNGMWQIISITFDLLERPIPTPVHQLRPARETCEKCHWPNKFYGSRLQTIVRYGKGHESTPRYTTLNLKVDAGKGMEKGGIHWHTNEKNLVRYSSVDDEREEMIWVEVIQPDGSFKRYTNKKLISSHNGHENERILDCVDCHNRATHIFEDFHDAVDGRIRLGLLDRSLSYLKRDALAAVTAGYPDAEAAMEGIANHMHGFYRRRFPDVAIEKSAQIDKAVSVLQATYNRNIHHQLNLTWGTYPSHIGHKGDQGCFRCHNTDLVNENGASISGDCTLCHSILAFESDEAFEYLLPVDSTNRDFRMHQYLQQEFLEFLAD